MCDIIVFVMDLMFKLKGKSNLTEFRFDCVPLPLSQQQILNFL